MDLQLSDKTVVVTGGTGSLGTKAVEMLVDSGAHCMIPIRDRGELEDYPFKDYDQVGFITDVDLSDEQQTLHFYNEVADQFGSPWAILNIAGGFGMGKIGNISLDDFLHQMQMNTYTCFNSCRAAIQKMRKENSGGRIVNIASRPAINPRQGSGLSAYTSSKAAVAALTQALAAELVEDEILVNAVAPSIIDTKPNRKAMPKADFNKWVDPENIASHMLYLISPKNQSTNGAVIPIYGRS